MGNPIVEEELQEAENLLAQYLTFRQFGAVGSDDPRLTRKQRKTLHQKAERQLDMRIEHFLRRDEPESAYYERFGDHDVATEKEN